MTTAQIFAAGMFLLLFMSKNVTSDYLFFLIFFLTSQESARVLFFFPFFLSITGVFTLKGKASLCTL